MKQQVQTKFNIGDTVTSKQTGFPAIGTVIGIQMPEIYGPEIDDPQGRFSQWHKLYPDWREKLIYYVRYNTPQRPITFEEWLVGFDKYWEQQEQKTGETRTKPPTEDLHIMYQNKTPIQKCASFPEDDLENVE